MIVKMIILRLLGSSDDKEKEKIGVARPDGLPLWGFRKKFLQHRFNRRSIGVYHRCNDVSAQEKILKHRMNR